jgi:hypothetical protein
MELPADRILWGDCECVAKRAVRKPDRQVGLQHEEAFTDCLDEIQWVDFAHGKRLLPHLLMAASSTTANRRNLVGEARDPPILIMSQSRAWRR